MEGAIGAQDFDDNLVSVSVDTSGLARWAIANSNGGVHLFDEDGSWLGDFKSTESIRGVALMSYGGNQCLLISTESGVTKWDVTFSSSNILPASHQEQ